MNKLIAWTIAGSDSSGSAGIQADINTFSSLGVQACTVITGVTAQNQGKLTDIQFINVDPQLAILLQEHSPQAIKIGMLGKKSIVDSVRQFLHINPTPAILDPVMVATSGGNLFSEDNLQYASHLQTLFPYIELFTPNIPEAEIILKRHIITYKDIEQAARELITLGINSVLIKGGHFANDAFSQDFWTDGKEAFWLASQRHPQGNFRGTGCTLSSAITAARAHGYALKDAIVIGKMYINQAMHLSIKKRLHHQGWPEDQQFLPYLTPQPINENPQPFIDCGNSSLGLYPVVDSAEWVKLLLPLGVKTIQLRIKDKSDLDLVKEIQQAIRIATQHNARLFINDYWELAIEYGAYGVHLGQSDLATADIEKIRKAGLRLGISTHGFHELARAHSLHPSYIAFGPIFPTTLKKMTAQGMDKLKLWRRMLNYTLVAIGGINLERAPAILATGVDGIAMISAITQAENPSIITQSLLALFKAKKLSPEEIQRYTQQITLKNIGLSGQMKLKNARVLCIGAGGLASPLLLYLAAAGVGTIGIVDDDQVELSNLQRQILFGTANIGSSKVSIAQQQILKLNPHTKVELHPLRFNQDNAVNIISGYDIVADCTDNFASKYLLSDACFHINKPYVYASISQYSGQCALFDGLNAPCFRCLFPTQPPINAIADCSQGGVLGVLPGLLGVIQATEVLKWLLNIGNSLHERLLTIDILIWQVKEYYLTQNPDCEFCRQYVRSDSCSRGCSTI